MSTTLCHSITNIYLFRLLSKYINEQDKIKCILFTINGTWCRLLHGAKHRNYTISTFCYIHTLRLIVVADFKNFIGKGILFLVSQSWFLFFRANSIWRFIHNDAVVWCIVHYDDRRCFHVFKKVLFKPMHKLLIVLVSVLCWWTEY